MTKKKKQQHQFAYIHLKYHGLYFTEYRVHNFEIRVGENEDLEKNYICYKQFEFMLSVASNISCPEELYGDWISINKTATPYADEPLSLTEVRVFGSKYSCNSNCHSKMSLIISCYI